MTSAWDEKSVFLAALELPLDQRDQYLRTACPDDAARHCIESLLEHHNAVTREILSAVPPAEQESTADALTRIEEFQIVRRLGEGGMGVVYLAEDLILGRRIALKVLSPGLTGSEDALARFRTEARSAAAIKHPAIVPVYKFGSDGTTHYIASEYVDGPTLAQEIEKERGRRTGRIHTSELRSWHRRAAETISTIAEALEAAHRQQISHRDVKPSNILMDREQGPRLTDFGIARHLAEEGRIHTTTLLGTCHYMSPEQASIAKARVDQRSDIFSLGVVLYELVALRRPFDGESHTEILRAVAEKEAPRLRTVDRRIPRDLEVICQKAMEKRPKDRYQSTAHVAADLRCFLEDRPILAIRPRLTRRMRHWARSHQKFMLLSASFVLVTLSLCTLAFVMSRESRHWRAQRCALDLIGIGADILVHVRPFDPNSFELGARMAISQPRDRLIWLLPGQYRIEFQAPDGQFDEVDRLCLEPGEHHLVIPLFQADAEDTLSMVLVPRGSFQFRRPHVDESESPRYVAVEAFWIDQHEVTNRQYSEFLANTGHKRPQGWGESWPPLEYDNHPVVGITWDDMQAYAHWARKRLPTVLEWEHAARWPDRRLLPWGEVEPVGYLHATGTHHELMNEANWPSGMQVYADLAQPVYADPHPSALGLHFMFGNAAEMTSTVTILEPTRAVMVKGGSWMDRPESYDLAGIKTYPLGAASMTVGFRCAKSVAPDKQNLERRSQS